MQKIISEIVTWQSFPALFGGPADFLADGPFRKHVCTFCLPGTVLISLLAKLFYSLLELLVFSFLLFVLGFECGKVLLKDLIFCFQLCVLSLQFLYQCLFDAPGGGKLGRRTLMGSRLAGIQRHPPQLVRTQLLGLDFFDFHTNTSYNKYEATRKEQKQNIRLTYIQSFQPFAPTNTPDNNNQMAETAQKDIRTQMLEALAKYNIKQVDVAREAGIHHSTLSLWLQGKVKGHHIKIEDTLAQWLDSLYSGRPRYTTLNKTVDKQFVLTPAAVNITKKAVADSEQVLIPIHFDLQLEGKRYKQQFCWNINDPYFTPQQFAHLMVTENPSLSHFEGHIRDTIRKAIASYRTSKVQSNSCIRTLELDVRIDSICLKDRFDWDINDDTANPEDFAYQLVKELNLNNEFMVKIAHQIREQLQYYRKNNIPALKSDDSALLDIKKSTRNLISLSDNPSSLPQQVQITATNFLRRNNQDWQPKVQILDAGQVRKFQKQEQRQNRYARRTR